MVMVKKDNIFSSTTEERRPRVSIIEPTGAYAGMDGYDISLARSLGNNGIDVVLFTSSLRAGATEYATWRARFVYSRCFGQFPKPVKMLSYLAGTLSALLLSRREKRRCVHYHFYGGRPREIFDLLMIKLSRLKLIITVHDVESLFTRKRPTLSRRLLSLADGVIVHNASSKAELCRVMKSEPRHIAVIPLGSYTDTVREGIDCAEARIRLGLPLDAPVLLLFGHIKEVKGPDLLIRAMPRILSDHPATVLCIAGRPQGKDFSEYEALIESQQIVSNCKTFIRFIDNDELPLFYSASDLVVLPYRRIYQSGVLVLAMGYAKPVVVSDLPGMVEIVTDGETGFVFKSEDVEELANVISRALSNPDKMRAVGQAGAELIRRKFAWENIAVSTANFYAEVLNGKHSQNSTALQ